MQSKTNRKLIRLGNTSLGVTIPISWTKYFNLSYGDEVEVICNRSITIKPIVKEGDGGD